MTNRQACSWSASVRSVRQTDHLGQAARPSGGSNAHPVGALIFGGYAAGWTGGVVRPIMDGGLANFALASSFGWARPGSSQPSDGAVRCARATGLLTTRRGEANL